MLIVADGATHDTSGKHKLDQCVIRTSTPVDQAFEYFSSPATIGSLGLDFDNDEHGLKLTGTYAGLCKVLHFEFRIVFH